MTEPTASEQQPNVTTDAVPKQNPDRLRISDVSFVELMGLDHHGPDTYIGLAPRYPWGRLFGGQVVAQALRAAQMTVDRDYAVHSLHAYFIQGGTHREPVRFEVNRLRNGTSFWVRQVVARQSSGAILNLSASFQRAEEAVDVQTQFRPDDMPGPEDGEEQGWGGMVERRVVTKEFGHTSIWLRLGQELPDDPQLQACALAFLSDSVPSGAVRATHPVQVPREQIRKQFVGASLDHAVHFHRPVDPTQWMLADVVCHGLSGARGLSVANMFDTAGVQVASVVQEVLLRERRQESSADSGFGGKSL